MRQKANQPPAVYITMDRDNLVIGVGESNQNNLRSTDIVLEKAVVIDRSTLSADKDPRELFTKDRVKRLYEYNLHNMSKTDADGNQHKVRKAGVVLQFVERLDYL